MTSGRMRLHGSCRRVASVRTVGHHFGYQDRAILGRNVQSADRTPVVGYAARQMPKDFFCLAGKVAMACRLLLRCRPWPQTSRPAVHWPQQG
jgi:hypothetical protein